MSTSISIRDEQSVGNGGGRRISTDSDEEKRAKLRPSCSPESDRFPTVSELIECGRESDRIGFQEKTERREVGEREGMERGGSRPGEREGRDRESKPATSPNKAKAFLQLSLLIPSSYQFQESKKPSYFHQFKKYK